MAKPVIAIVDRAAQAYFELLDKSFPEASFVAAEDFETLGDAAALAEGLITFGLSMTPKHFDRFGQLRWLQALSTGVDHLLPFVSGRPLVLTSARGIHRAAVSELAMLLMLALARGLPTMFRAQSRHEWSAVERNLLDGKALGIIGLGVISEALAEKSNAFGMSVTGFTNTPREFPGIRDVRSYADLPDAVGDLDFLVSVAPLTAQSRRMVDRRMFQQMKPGLIFINVGRGGTVDEAAMIEALRSGRLGGAGLDTVEAEPLDPGSPLWDMENVIITPHVGGLGDSYVDRASALLTENVAAFLAGRPLRNVVEATAGI